MNWKKRAGIVAAYAAFFLAVFVLSLYVTFDARVLGGLIQQGARSQNLDLSFDQIKLAGLTGLDFRGLQISPVGAAPDSAFKMNRLKLSPSLSSLLGLAGKGKSKSLDLSFEGWLTEGKALSGRIRTTPPGMLVKADINNLPIEALPWAMLSPKAPPLSGRLTAKIDLNFKDQSKPDTWDCDIQADIIRPAVADFMVSGFSLPGMSAESGKIKLKISQGKGQLQDLKFQGGDIPLDLSGDVSLVNCMEGGRFNIGKTMVNIKGSIEVSDEYKSKNEMIAQFLPSTKNFNYQGVLETVLAGMR